MDQPPVLQYRPGMKLAEPSSDLLVLGSGGSDEGVACRGSVKWSHVDPNGERGKSLTASLRERTGIGWGQRRRVPRRLSCFILSMNVVMRRSQVDAGPVAIWLGIKECRQESMESTA